LISPHKQCKQEENGVKYFKQREETHTHTHTQNSILCRELSFKSEREIKSFSDKNEKLKKRIPRPALQEMLKEVLQCEGK